jgi:hypothetical protein
MSILEIGLRVIIFVISVYIVAVNVYGIVDTLEREGTPETRVGSAVAIVIGVIAGVLFYVYIMRPIIKWMLK